MTLKYIIQKWAEDCLSPEEEMQIKHDILFYGGVVTKHGRVIPMEDYIKETGTVEENKIVDMIKSYTSEPYTEDN